MFNTILVRYDEIGVKGKNRGWFEDLLVRNIKNSLAGMATVTKYRGRLVVHVADEKNNEEIFRRLKFIPGISSFSPTIAIDIEDGWEEIERVSLLLADEAIKQNRRIFRVSCSRPNKQFPMKSPEVQKRLSGFVLSSRDKEFTVSMKEHNFNLELEIAQHNMYLFMDRYKGLNGMPVGSAGDVLCLLSGGIDSPVASFMCMKRGAKVHYISYYSPPYTGEESMDKLNELAGAIKKYQGVSTKLFVAPLIDIQLLIRARCLESYRTVLFRRMMFKIAERIAKKHKFKALVTGESMSQVASQTLENLHCINNALKDLPVIRPLITFDKQETIEVAKRIGTFEISIKPCADSCTAFLPEGPVTRGRMDIVEREEAKLYPEIEKLLDESVAGVEVTNV